MICRFIWDDGSGYISDAINCLKLCRDDGALIASNSWGGIAYRWRSRGARNESLWAH